MEETRQAVNIPIQKLTLGRALNGLPTVEETSFDNIMALALCQKPHRISTWPW